MRFKGSISHSQNNINKFLKCQLIEESLSTSSLLHFLVLIPLPKLKMNFATKFLFRNCIFCCQLSILLGEVNVPRRHQIKFKVKAKIEIFILITQISVIHSFVMNGINNIK